MPSFTLELWRVLDLKPSDVSEDEWLGLHDYPIFDADYRDGLNQKIKRHYMFQEIGLETVAQFRFAMQRKMHEIMETYNQLYRTTLLDVDPLSTVDIRTVSTGVQEQVSEGETANMSESDIDAKSKNVASNFPQVALSPNKDYATSGADSNSQTKTKADVNERSTAENSATSESESRTSGYQGSVSQLILQARAAVINVDLMVIRELDDLFMGIWDSSDEIRPILEGFHSHDYSA